MNRMTNRMLTAAVAAGMLAAVPTPLALAKDVYIAGTAGPGSTSAAVDPGEYTWATGKPYDPDQVYILQYPRALYPLVGDQMLWQSVHAGATTARPHIESGDHILAISQGALVAEQIKQWALADGVTNLTIVTYGDPGNHDGGILTKVWLPTAPILRPTPQPEGYHQITYAIEYEIVADAPDVSILENPLAWANSAMAGVYDHPTYSQALIDRAEAEGRLVRTEDEYGVHYLIKQADLPLTRPIREAERFLTGQTALTDGLDRVLKPIVDSGYSGPRTQAAVDDSATIPSTTREKPRPVRDLVKRAVDTMKTGNKFRPGDTVAKPDSEVDGATDRNQPDAPENTVPPAVTPTAEVDDAADNTGAATEADAA